MCIRKFRLLPKSMKQALTLTINGAVVSTEVEPRTLLVELLREHSRLTGTHVGCDTAQCGACVVDINGQSVKSCSTLAVQHEGATVTTIEGIAGAELHPMQSAFQQHHGLQCGFCTPGIIMSVLDLVKHYPQPTESEARAWLDGNLCRCTGYHNIVQAVQAGARAMQRDNPSQ